MCIRDRHRGYGYVAVSRFRTQAGCYLYGKLRATDFLPVGPEQEDEQLYRGVHSASGSDSDDRSSIDSVSAVSWNRLSEDDTDDSHEQPEYRDDMDSEGEYSEVSDLVKRRRHEDMSD